MFHFLHENAPIKKESGVLNSNDGKYKIKYIATPAREVFRCYEGTEQIADIFVSLSVLKELQVKMEKIQVSGNYEPFIAATGLVGETSDNWDISKYKSDKKAKGSTNKIKGWEYEKYETDFQYENLIELDSYESITDFIYKTRSLDKIVEEDGVDLSWLKKKNYRILRKREEIEEWIEGLAAYDTSSPDSIPVGFDTETSGLECNRTKNDILVGLCMSYEDDGGVYFPLQHLRMANIEMDMGEFLDKLKPYCHKGSPQAKKLITHNGKFDWGVMKMHGWEVNITDDTLTRQALLNIGKAKNLMKLKKIAEAELGIDVIELEDVYDYPKLAEIKAIKHQLSKGASCDAITERKLFEIENAKDIKQLMDFRYVPEDFVEVYGPADADFPRLIYKKTQEEWNENKQDLEFIYNIEIALIGMLGEQEYYGVKVVKEEFERLYEEAVSEMEKLEQEIYGLAGYEFKIGGAETEKAFYDVCGVPHHPRYKTKSGSRSVDKHALSYYTQFTNKDGTPKYPIAEKLQKYNKLKTLVSSFYGKLPKLVRKGYVFPQYNNLRAETGRLTCSNPNVQQTEPQSREYMVPDTDDHYFLICDFSQVEYRLMSGLAGEKGVVDFFNNDSEADYHIMAYSNMHGIPYAKVTSKQRKEGKVLNFGTSYGLQDKALALSLYGDDNEAAQKKAHAAREKYFDGVPRIRDYFEEERDAAQESFFAKTILGRRRFIQQFEEASKLPDGRKKEMLQAKGRRVAGNMPVQGLAADIMKLAMIRLRNRWREYGYYEDQARAVLNVHDEVCYQIHKDIHPHIAIKIMREAMEVDMSRYGIPPLYIGGNVGYHWKDGKVDELEAPVELMSRMIEDANHHLENNIPYERVEDPRKFWEDAITRYNLEVLHEEYKRGYDDPDTGTVQPIHNIDDALRSVRIAKYSTHHGKYSKYILGLVMHKGDQFVWDNLSRLLNDKQLVLGTLNKVLDLKDKVPTFNDAKERHSIRTFAEYFGDFGGTVLNAIYEENTPLKDVSVGKGEVKIVFEGFEKTYTNKISLQNEKPVAEGSEIEDDFESLEEKVDRLCLVDEKALRFTVNGDELSVQGLGFILDLLMPLAYINSNPSILKQKTYNMSLDLGSSKPEHIPGKKLIAPFLPFVKKAIMVDLTTSDFTNLENEINEVMGKLM